MKAPITKPTVTITIGTRTSTLALWQTNHVIDRLQALWPGLIGQLQPFVTQGDKSLDKPLPVIGGKGLFTAELERSLLAGEIDLAVHSLKDLPVEDAPGLTIGAITSRADVRDAVVARHGWTLATLLPGAVVGTSSTRRAAQLQALRPDLVIRSIRGNVETRIRKTLTGDYDATLLALAGLERLDLLDHVTERLPLDVMLPAPGQGALAVQCRADDQATLSLLAALDDAPVRAAVSAERAFLHALGGGCSAPVAAYAQVRTVDRKPWLHLQALVAASDGQKIVRVTGEVEGLDSAILLGEGLAEQALHQGAADLVIQKAGFAQVPPVEAAAIPLSSAPLQGKRIVVTRPQTQSAALIDQLTALGATPLIMPTIRIEPLADLSALDAALRTIHQYDWLIFTSANSVEIFAERLCECALTTLDLAHLQIATIGPATTEVLRQYGLTPTFIPAQFMAEEVASGLAARIGDLHGLRMLLPQAAIARQNLAQALAQQGAHIDAIALYQTLPAALDATALAELQAGVDIITFTSGSTVRNFVQGLLSCDYAPARLQTAIIACIGPQTAAVAHELGLRVDVIAAEYTVEGLVAAIIAYFQTDAPDWLVRVAQE